MESVFAKHLGEVFTFRSVTVQFENRIFGGIPQRPDVIEAWIRKGTGINQKEEMAAVMRRTLMEMDPELADQAKNMSTFELMKLASEKLASSQSSVGFKRDETGLFIESRQIKAGLREATNILYAGKRWGETKKGPKSWLAERVFVGPERIHLNVPGLDGQLAPAKEYTDLDLFVGHVTGPQGPRSTLTYYQFVERAQITFTVATIQDDVIAQEWPRIWVALEQLGFGALRSQDAGRFAVVHWEEVSPVPLSTLRPAHERLIPEEEAVADPEGHLATQVERVRREAALAGAR